MSERQTTAIKAVCVQRGHVYRLERVRDGEPVGTAVALTNGRWLLCDLDERELAGSFGSPKETARQAELRRMGA